MAFVLAALLLAFCDWIAIWKAYPRLGMLTKPAVVLALIAGLWWGGDLAAELGAPGIHTLEWLAAGLIFSLAGDVLLMLPRENLIGGGIAFVFAYLAYSTGLLSRGFPTSVFWPLAVLGVMIAIVWGRVFAKVQGGSILKGMQQLQAPLAFQTLVLATMLFAALSRLALFNWLLFPAYLVGAGGLLIFLSDVWLLNDRFASPIANARLKIRITYHLGQIGLVAGVLLYFNK